jgi:ATP-dependent RNA helicase RhlB
MYFRELNLQPSLMQGITERGYTEMTEVQEQTLSHTLRGTDAAVQSQTGTGKTAAFLVTIYERISRGIAPRGKKALIIVPTRELAVQIEGEARLLGRHMGLRVGCFYGGIGYAGQLSALKRGVDIVIGTPGRLLDLSERGSLNLKEVGLLFIDEADRLFDMGFLPDIKRLLQSMVPRTARQSMLFSATLSRVSRKIASEYLNSPAFVELAPEQMTVDTITQKLYRVKSHIKTNLLLGILQDQNPRNALIFTNMRHSAFRLAKTLERNGYRCRHLSGDLPQSQRLRIIDDFMAGKFSHLVATDVAARGLHIEGLEMVINYDLPQDIENYVHRIGRTARAGNTGQAVSFVCEKFGKYLDEIESFIGMKIPVETARAEMFLTDRGTEFESKERRARRAAGPDSSRQHADRKPRHRMSWDLNTHPA